MNKKHYRKRNHILKISLLFLIVLLAAILYRTCQLNAESPGTIIKTILTELSNHTTTDSSENWELLLVNRTHKIPAHYSVTLTELSNGKKVGQRIYPSLQQMFDDARAAGLSLFVREGYRTAEDQQRTLALPLRGKRRRKNHERRKSMSGRISGTIQKIKKIPREP